MSGELVPRSVIGLDGLHALVGAPLGPSPWQRVSQRSISAFADVTGDRQWIHVDPARAATGPFGATIAHGLLLLSLIPRAVRSLYVVEDLGPTINYGFDRIRFLVPVAAGDHIRIRLSVVAVDHGGTTVRVRHAIETQCETRERPAVTATYITAYAAPERSGDGERPAISVDHRPPSQ